MIVIREYPCSSVAKLIWGEAMSDLRNKTIFITGSSRGIGREIALRCARDGAKVVITGKTVEAHAKAAGHHP